MGRPQDMSLSVGGVDVEPRDYECSNCGAFFQSKAKKVGNARHKCDDGKTGAGRLLDRSNPPKEPLPENEDFESPIPEASELEVVDGDAEFTVTADTEEIEPEGPPIEMAHIGDEPKKERPKKHKATPKQDATQIQTIFKAIYAATGSVELTPDEEMEIVANLWAGVGEVHIDTGEVYVPAWIYIATAALLTASLMGRRQLGAMKKNKAVVKPPDIPVEKKTQDIKKGWDSGDEWA